MSQTQKSHAQTAHPTDSPEELNKLAQPERARRDQAHAAQQKAIGATTPEVPRAEPPTTTAELPPANIKTHAVPARHPHEQR